MTVQHNLRSVTIRHQLLLDQGLRELKCDIFSRQLLVDSCERLQLREREREGGRGRKREREGGRGRKREREGGRGRKREREGGRGRKREREGGRGRKRERGRGGGGGRGRERGLLATSCI